MFGYGYFRSDDELLCIRIFGKVHDTRGRAYVICVAADGRLTFGVNEDECIRVLFLSCDDLLLVYSGVDGAAALNELEILFG